MMTKNGCYLHVIRKGIYEAGDVIRADNMEELLDKATESARRMIGELCGEPVEIIVNDWDQEKLEQFGYDTVYGFASTKPTAANAKQFRIKLFNDAAPLDKIAAD